jgi:hypothetical protein
LKPLTRGRGQVLEPNRTAVLDAVRLGPADDATAVTADQLRSVVGGLTAAGHWHEGDPDMLIVMDSGYDVARLAFVLADLPVEVLGRIRSDRVLRLPKPPRPAGATGRPPKHGPEFALNTPLELARTCPHHDDADHPLRRRHRLQLGPAASTPHSPWVLARP